MKLGQPDTICLIEDDLIMGQSLMDRFKLEKISCHWHQTLKQAKNKINQFDYTIIVSDIRLPDGNSETLLDELRAMTISIPPLIFITAYGDLRHAVRLLRNGASDYITKPFSMDYFLDKIYTLIPGMKQTSEPVSNEAILGISSIMQDIQHKLIKTANFDAPVLITGESGVGKEYAASFLHQSRTDAENLPFVSVNCAAIPENLLEAELFGYEAGAFTDAKNSRKGLFEEAQNGTLFLDEVGEMSIVMQTKLLRAIQEKKIRRIGSNTDIHIDFHLICATNRELQKMIKEGGFRVDLFFRINIIPVHIPPLRERREDTDWFIDRFISDHCKKAGTPPRQISLTAKSYLQTRYWPGNIRELYAYIERACIFSNSGILSLSDVSDGISLSSENNNEHNDLKSHLAICERTYILDAIDKENGCINTTAKRLGISRKNLWEKMKKHHIEIHKDQITK